MKIREQPLSNKWHRFDYLLFCFVLMTTGFGILVLAGGTLDVPGKENIVPSQIQWWKLSLGVFCFALLVPYRWLLVFGWPLYFISLFLLSLLLFAAGREEGFLTAIRAGGAASWLRINLGGASIRFQPSEFAKIAMVLVLAQWLAWRRERLNNIRECIVPILIMAVPVAIIIKQPDLGTASIFLPLPFILLFVAGLRWKIAIVSAILGFLALAAAGVYLTAADRVPGLKEYQLRRIRVFLNPIASPFQLPGVEQILYGESPEAADLSQDEDAQRKKKGGDEDEWHIRQAEMALGSGRVIGKGWGKGTQSRYGFLPEHWTDFIFSSLGEQFGLMGCLTLLLFYLLIVWRAVHISVQTADFFGKYLVVGLLSIVLIHIVMNIGMTVRLLPVTGVPLPLVSYGGSSLAMNYLIFGLIANVGLRRVEPEV